MNFHILLALKHLPIFMAPIDPNAVLGEQEVYDVSPLWLACETGSIQCAQMLLDAKAQIHQSDGEGRSPLWMACANDLTEDQADHQNRSPLWIACDAGHLEVAELLLEAGADQEQADELGSSPSSAASARGFSEVVALLTGEDTKSRACRAV
eukprot:g63.t1